MFIFHTLVFLFFFWKKFINIFYLFPMISLKFLLQASKSIFIKPFLLVNLDWNNQAAASETFSLIWHRLVSRPSNCMFALQLIDDWLIFRINARLIRRESITKTKSRIIKIFYCLIIARNWQSLCVINCASAELLIIRCNMGPTIMIFNTKNHDRFCSLASYLSIGLNYRLLITRSNRGQGTTYRFTKMSLRAQFCNGLVKNQSFDVWTTLRFCFCHYQRPLVK